MKRFHTASALSCLSSVLQNPTVPRPKQTFNMVLCRDAPDLEDIQYPFHDKIITVTTCGQIFYKGQKVNLSLVFAGQKVGIKQITENIWLVSFMHYDLGYFDKETYRMEPIENPFSAKVLPMSQV